MAPTLRVWNITYTGADQVWPVPADAGMPLTVDLRGAGGGPGGAGGATPPAGGAGGRVLGKVTLQPGVDSLILRVGQAGATAVTSVRFGGGGQGGTGSSAGAAGGGATSVYLTSTTIANLLAIAGGGGGAGRDGTNAVTAKGGDGGNSTGQTGGLGQSGVGATGGTLAAGGTGGTGSTSGSNGASLVGGAGGNNTTSPWFGGGGGGGGRFGGGGGGSNGSSVRSGGGGGGSSFVAPSFTASINTQGTGAASSTNGIIAISYIPTPQAPSIFGFTCLDPEGIIATGPGWVLNPDFDLRIQWQYIPDTLNVAPHWKSYIDYNTDGSGVYLNFANLGEVTVKSAPAYSIMSTVIPAGTLLPGFTYRIRIRDMNSAVEQYGPGTTITITTPARPATPVWTNPANAFPVFTSISSLPFRGTWTAATQRRWKVQQFINQTDTIPIWDSGWHRSSVKAGLIEPPQWGFNCWLKLFVHDGAIASAGALTSVIFPVSTTLNTLHSVQKIELEVYDRLTGDFISNIPYRISPTFLEEHRGPGAGSFMIRLDDPTWAANPTLIDPGNIVRIKDGGRYIGFWEITGHTPVPVSADEHSGETIIVRGLGGYGAWPAKAILYPERGTQDFAGTPPLIRQKRAFGVASSTIKGNWFDVTDWTLPFQQVRQDNVVDPTTGGNPWRNAPTDWPVDLKTAYWLWSYDSRTWGIPGIIVFKTSIDVPFPGPVALQLYMAADDEAQAYIDGDPWLYSNAWQSTAQSEATMLGSGTHELTVVVAQGLHSESVADWYKNPAGLLLGLYGLSDAGSAATHFVDMVSSNATLISNNYPAIIPCWTIGDILQTLYNEALARGVTAFGLFDLGFDDEIDSYGKKWVKQGNQWFFDVGLSYNQIFDKLTDTACDIWFDENLVLRAARTRGVDRGQLNPAVTYTDLVVQSDPDYFWDFKNAWATGHITAAAVDVDYFLDSSGTAICMEFTDFKFSTPHKWYNFNDDGALAKLAPPSSSMYGLIEAPAALWPADISFFQKTSLDPTHGNAALPLTGADGFSVEFLMSNAYFDLQLTMYAAGDSTVFPIVPTGYNFEVRLDDDTSNKFDSLLITTNLDFTGDNTRASIRNDNFTHHWVVNFFNEGSESVVVVYRDGAEVTSVSVPMPFLATQVAPGLNFVQGGGTLKTHGGPGQFALYQRLLTEDEIYSHYQGSQDGNLVRVDPIIFRKAKNVLAASATVDFAAKTMLLTRSNGVMAEIKATPGALAKYGRIEGYYDGSDKSYSDARRTASSTIQASLQAQTSSTIDIAKDYVPWRDFGVGDWVLAPGDYGEELVRRRVMSLSISEDPDTGESVYAMEIDSLNQETNQRLALWMQRTLPQGNLGGLIADQG